MGADCVMIIQIMPVPRVDRTSAPASRPFRATIVGQVRTTRAYDRVIHSLARARDGQSSDLHVSWRNIERTSLLCGVS